MLTLSAASLFVIILCLVLARQQLNYWQESEPLFLHPLAVTEKNNIARFNPGFALAEKRQTGYAINQYQQVIRFKPD